MKLKNKSIVGAAMSLLFVIGLFAFASTNVAAQEKGEKQDPKLAKQAKITMAQARAIAAKKAEGKIEGEELEKENGKLIYSFDIRNAKGTITEVQVDAKTGAIVSVEEENKAAEQKEKQQDRKEKSKKKKS